MNDLPVYLIEFDKNLFSKAIDCAFNYIEFHDDIVGMIYANPDIIKKIVLTFSDEVKFDYVHQGIGIFRTAYLKYLPSVKENGIWFINQHETFKLKLSLI
jgi:hypothetical protein